MSGWLEGHPGLPRLLAGLERLDDTRTAQSGEAGGRAGGERGGKPMAFAEHARVHGELPRRPAHELIDSIERSGLRGRGGADFPTATKLRAVAAGRRVSAVVVNGSETEPASAKDRLLLSRLPHLVLDGAMLAAEVVGAPEVIVKVGESSTGSLQALEGAIAVRNADPATVRLVAAPEGYVAGEESAVIHYLNGGPELPLFVPPRPYERGYRRRPTLIQNPETLAQVALVARFGERWYRELGTSADPGSVLVTISGAVAAPGVYEMAFGTPLAELLEAAGGPSERVRALLVGGYFGTWIDASAMVGLRLARQELRSVGCALGSGVLIVLGESSCGLHETARVIDYLAEQSAGQCGPCVLGLRALADGVAALAEGKRAGDRERLVRWASEIRGRGACHHPDGAVRFVLSAISVFAQEIEEHRRGRCTARSAGLPLGRVSVRKTPVARVR